MPQPHLGDQSYYELIDNGFTNYNIRDGKSNQKFTITVKTLNNTDNLVQPIDPKNGEKIKSKTAIDYNHQKDMLEIGKILNLSSDKPCQQKKEHP